MRARWQPVAAVCLVAVAACGSDRPKEPAPAHRATWERRSVTEDFAVRSVPIGLPTTGAPLDVSFDAAGGAWVIGEFGSDAAVVDGAEVRVVETPDGTGGGAFADPLHPAGSCGRTTRSALAERIVVAAGGEVWFTQGGELFADPACRRVNHSRLVRYDPATGEACVVPLPGVDGEAIGAALDPDHDRVWFTLPLGSEGPALGWVDDDPDCADGLDWSDPAAVEAATAQVHLVPIEHGVLPAHLAVDAGAGVLWFTDFGGRALGRYPLDGRGDVEYLPLPASRSGGPFHSYPWQLRVVDGDVWFVEYDDDQLVRFDPGTDADCTELDDGANPCMTQVTIPLDAPAHHAHSLAAAGDRLWFTVAAEPREDEPGAGPAFGSVDLRTLDGVLYDDLTGLAPATGGHAHSFRGIDVDPGSGRLAIADAAGELVLLTPR